MAKTQGAKNMTVKFFPNDKGNPPGKLADAELHFSGGPLDGLKLIGFAIWERRNGGRNVTFPARQYSVNGERRSFALLRPAVDARVAGPAARRDPRGLQGARGGTRRQRVIVRRRGVSHRAGRSGLPSRFRQSTLGGDRLACNPAGVVQCVTCASITSVALRRFQSLERVHEGGAGAGRSGSLSGGGAFFSTNQKRARSSGDISLTAAEDRRGVRIQPTRC